MQRPRVPSHVFSEAPVFGYAQDELQTRVFSGQLLSAADLFRFQLLDHGPRDTFLAFTGHPERALLYYYLLGHLASVLPVDPARALRGISAVFGLLLIPTAFWLMRDVAPTDTASRDAATGSASNPDDTQT